MMKRLIVMFSLALVMFSGSAVFAQDALVRETDSDSHATTRFGVGLASRTLQFNGVSAIFPIEWSRVRLEPGVDVSWSRSTHSLPAFDQETSTSEIVEYDSSRLDLGLGAGLHYMATRTEHFAAYFGGEVTSYLDRRRLDTPDDLGVGGLGGLGGLGSSNADGTSAGVRVGPLFGFEVRGWDHVSFGAEGAVLSAVRLYDRDEGAMFRPGSVHLAGAFKLRYLF